MKSLLKILFVIVLIAVVILLVRYCEKTPCESCHNAGEAAYLGYNIRLDGMSPERFRDSLEHHLDVTLGPESFYVCPCDTTLVNLRLNGVTIEGHGPVRVRTQTGGVGLDLEFPFGKNYVLASETDYLPRDFVRPWMAGIMQDSTTGSTKERRFNPFTMTARELSGAVPANVVAVFDAGLHPSLNSMYYQSVLGLNSSASSLLCGPEISVPLNTTNRLPGVNLMPDEATGVVNYSDIADNTQMQHGTKVTHILASQRINQPSGAPLRILAMKILDRQNKGDLFSLMCAMSQAEKLGAKIFNLSLGYYGREDTLLRKQIESLAAKKIWVVTAAGNAMSDFDDPDASLEQNRDLGLRPEKSRFYPAYFSEDMNHVISVTTVNNTPDSVIHNQNYGKEVVDVGVVADNGNFIFMNGAQTVRIQGTSYATPAVSGWLARKPGLDGFADKEALLSDATESAALTHQIKKGRYIKANQN